MIISELEFHDTRRDVHLSQIKFERFNLLKGCSGAGKSTIIDAIYTLSKIAQGLVSPGDSWTVKFSDIFGRLVVWQGGFAQHSSGELVLGHESINVEGKTLYIKAHGVCRLDGQIMVLDDDTQSGLFLFSSHADMRALRHSWASVAVYHHDCMTLADPTANVAVDPVTAMAAEHYFKRKPTSSINEMHHNFIELDCREKIYYAFHHDKAAFEAFETLYCMIFQQVTAVIPTMITVNNNLGTKPSASVQTAAVGLTLRNGQQINQSSISHGMFKSMMIIANCMFSSPHALIIYDGIDNGLDHNCMSFMLWSMQALKSQHIIVAHGNELDQYVAKEQRQWVERLGSNIKVCPAAKQLRSTA